MTQGNEQSDVQEIREWDVREKFSDEMLQKMEQVLPGKLSRIVRSSLAGCVHCGMCADACHYSRSMPENEKMMPAYKADRFRKWYKSRFDWAGKFFPSLVGARKLDQELAQEMYDLLWGACTMCRRCTFNCPMGVDYGMVTRAARAIMTEVGRVPKKLQDIVDLHYSTGNQMGVTRDDLIETLEWIEDELRDEEGCKDFRIPLDKQGAEFMFTLNPREPKYYPLLIQASAKVLNAAGVDFTISTRHWDMTNVAMFNGIDPDAKQFGKWIYDEMGRLGCKTLVSGECGHGYRYLRWEMPNWMGGVPFKITSIVELMAQFIRNGRIKLDKSVWKDKVFTYHDSCNTGRSGGIFAEPRTIIHAASDNFVEMEHNRVESFCCGGGGGAMAMPEFYARRMAASRIKANEIFATGANVVLQSCHNCDDQLIEICKFYRIDAQVMNLTQVVAPALVLS
jgi:Fe-S oxidoreductase